MSNALYLIKKATDHIIWRLQNLQIRCLGNEFTHIEVIIYKYL